MQRKFTAQAVCVCHITENDWTSKEADKKMRSYICINRLLFHLINKYIFKHASMFSQKYFFEIKQRVTLWLMHSCIGAEVLHVLPESIPGRLIWHCLPMDQLVVWAIVSPGGWPEPRGLGQCLGCFTGWGGEGEMGEEEGYRDGCRPRLGMA